jgi:RNA polymerase sigma-70 factor (ECF subfamily)
MRSSRCRWRFEADRREPPGSARRLTVVDTTPQPSAPRRVMFERVVEEVYEPLQRYLRRRCAADDVDDLLDDVLLVLWRRLDDVPDGAAVPWTYGVARRCLANHRRAGQRRQRLLARVHAGEAERDGQQWTSATDAALHRSLDRLPALDREVIHLWAWEQLEPREIAVVLETTPNAISVRLGRIQRRLAGELSRQDPAPSGHERYGSCEEQGR